MKKTQQHKRKTGFKKGRFYHFQIVRFSWCGCYYCVLGRHQIISTWWLTAKDIQDSSDNCFEPLEKYTVLMANQTEIKHLLILNSIFSLLERRKFIRFEYVPFKPNLPKPYDNHLRKKGIVLITQLTIHSHYLYCHFMLMRHIHSLWFDTQFVPLSCQKHTHTHTNRATTTIAFRVPFLFFFHKT